MQKADMVESHHKDPGQLAERLHTLKLEKEISTRSGEKEKMRQWMFSKMLN